MIAEIQTGQLNGDPVRSLPIKALCIPENGWPLRPFQIVSLLEVLKNYGHQFYLMGDALNSLDTHINLLSPAARKMPVSDDAKKSIQSTVNSIETCWRDIALGAVTLKGVERAKKEVAKEGITYAQFGAVIAELERRVNDELSAIRFFHVPPNGAQYYPRQNDEYKKPLFSPQTMKKFSKSIEDAEEAGKCFALARYTACVFHLMCVMERGVQRLGKKLRVTIPVEEKDWGVISSNINGALNACPIAPSQKERFTLATQRQRSTWITSGSRGETLRCTQRKLIPKKRPRTRSGLSDNIWSTWRRFFDSNSKER